jgi:hypothetical protein
MQKLKKKRVLPRIRQNTDLLQCKSNTKNKIITRIVNSISKKLYLSNASNFQDSRLGLGTSSQSRLQNQVSGRETLGTLLENTGSLVESLDEDLLGLAGFGVQKKAGLFETLLRLASATN